MSSNNEGMVMKITRGILPKAILALATCAVMASPAAAQIVFNSEFNPVTPTFGGVLNGRPFGNIKFYAEGFESYPASTATTAPGPWNPSSGGHGFVHDRPFFPDPNTNFGIEPTGFVTPQVLATGGVTPAEKYGWSPGQYLHLTYPSAQFALNSQFTGEFSNGSPPPASPTPLGSTKLRTVGDLPTGLYNLSFRIAAINALDGESGELLDTVPSTPPAMDDAEGIDLNLDGSIRGDAFDSAGDEFEIQLNGETVFRGSFDNADLSDQNAHDSLTARFLGATDTDPDTGSGDTGFFDPVQSVDHDGDPNTPNIDITYSGNQSDSLYEFDVTFGHKQGNGPIDLTFLPLGGIFGGPHSDTSQIEGFGIDDLLIQNVITPEPASVILYGMALVGVGAFAYRRRRTNRPTR